MTRLAEVLQQFTSRYRAALLTQAAVLAVLGIGVLGASAWRLQLLHAPSMWSVGVPAILAAAVVVSLGWWVRRHWLSFHQGAAYLDQFFGLQQRLVTAEEFAATAHPSPLYPLLVEDAVRRCETARTHLPKPLTRTSGALTLMLLLLLLWPRGGRPPIRLAQQPVPPPPPSPNGPPPPPPQPSEQSPNGATSRASPSADSGRVEGSRQQQSPASGGGSNQQQPQQSSGSSGQSRDEHQQGQGQQGQGQQGQGQQRQGSQDQGAQGQGSQAGDHGAQQQHAPSGGHAEGGRQAAQGKDAQQSAKQSAQQGAQSNGASSRSAEGRPSGGKELGAGSGQAPGDQAALKGEIQQLLKEVSGELKQLQAQLDTAKSEATPNAGTGTDAQLYGETSPLEPPGHTPLAIHLQTDPGAVKMSRPGGGVGSASSTASSASPQMPAETAQLSETPLEESSSARQTVPPEYVGIFDRLHRQRTQPPQPGEKTP